MQQRIQHAPWHPFRFGNPAIAALAAAPTLRRFASTILSEDCFAVRALFFDKTPDANWKVVWHQDLTIATRQRIDVPGYGPWTDKAGVPHVQPPIDILEQMLRSNCSLFVHSYCMRPAQRCGLGTDASFISSTALSR